MVFLFEECQKINNNLQKNMKKKCEKNMPQPQLARTATAYINTWGTEVFYNEEDVVRNK